MEKLACEYKLMFFNNKLGRAASKKLYENSIINNIKEYYDNHPNITIKELSVIVEMSPSKVKNILLERAN